VEVKLPDKNLSGFVLKDHTTPWSAPRRRGPSPLVIVLLAVAVAGLAGGSFYLWMRTKKNKEAIQLAAEIPAAIKRAEEHFRSADYDNAIREFRSYISLQGGEVRNPDVYRRLAVCYQQTDDVPAAVTCWEKMRSLGGVKTTDDYMLGVELMVAMGQESQAADIYEEIVKSGVEETKRYEIHRKLFDSYRRLKEPRKLMHHALKLIGLGTDVPEVVTDTVNYLLSEKQTDVALEFNDRDIIKGLCEELAADKVKTPEAARIYLKCLEYDRTDLRLHRILADMYGQSGEHRKAVSELTILSQLDKDQADLYVEQAARIYIDNSRVQEAIAEGNPLIIKKIAQGFLARSEVHPEAVAVYEKVLEFQPRLVGVNKILSTVYLTRGDLEKYTEKLRLLHEIDGQNHDYLADLAQCILDNQLVEETMREGHQDLNAKILKLLVKRGAFDDSSIEMFERLIKQDPDNALLRGVLAKAYEQKGDYPTSLDHFLALVKLKRNDQDLTDKAAKIAVRYNLLDRVLQQGTSTLVVSVARELARAKSEAPLSRQVIERALKERPGDKTLQGYLEAAVSASQPTSEFSTVEAEGVTSPPQSGASVPPVFPPREVRAEAKTDKVKHAKSDRRQEVRVPQKPDTPVSSPSPAEKSKSTTLEQTAAPGSASSQAPEKAMPPQFVSITDPNVSEAEKAVTTFVSGYDKASRLRYKTEELFLPKTGGLAYKDMQVFTEDGWGKVHTGVEVNTDRPVLIRVFRKDLLEPTIMVDFLKEITDLGFSMAHESVLPIEDEVDGPGGVHGLVHPCLPRTLEHVVRRENPPNANERIDLLRRILDGLVYAHNHKGLDGILRKTFHLHLQPSMIFLTEDLSQVRIAGLGYAQIYRNLTRGKSPRWQEPGMNPATMPPEFFRSKPGTIPERSSEVYSLGVLMYFAATGELPFEGPGFDDFKFQHTRIFAAPPRLINPSVPDWLEPIILTCLEKDSEKRWSNLVEIQRAFIQGSDSSRGRGV
jgi:tetratricopeptide (TPR) repeat protein